MQVSQIRQQLLQRRREILEQRESKDASWKKLQEPEIEFEEEAAEEKMSRILEQLDDQQKEEIERIDSALGKLETSGYGICESCGERISDGRLEAIPWTPYCIDCAEKQQREPARAVPGFERIEGAPRTESGGEYTDTEIQDLIED